MEKNRFSKRRSLEIDIENPNANISETVQRYNYGEGAGIHSDSGGDHPTTAASQFNKPESDSITHNAHQSDKSGLHLPPNAKPKDQKLPQYTVPVTYV